VPTFAICVTKPTVVVVERMGMCEAVSAEHPVGVSWEITGHCRWWGGEGCSRAPVAPLQHWNCEEAQVLMEQNGHQQSQQIHSRMFHKVWISPGLLLWAVLHQAVVRISDEVSWFLVPETV